MERSWLSQNDQTVNIGLKPFVLSAIHCERVFLGDNGLYHESECDISDSVSLQIFFPPIRPLDMISLSGKAKGMAASASSATRMREVFDYVNLWTFTDLEPEIQLAKVQGYPDSRDTCPYE